jgi:8-hydroxy-5-deazaflavin:NADPH oxidoreductase
VEDKTMATAVIGAGNIGKTVAGLLSDAGEPVLIATNRVPTDIAHQLGGSVTAATVADAIDQSEAVVFAVWLDVMKQLITEHSARLQGKVVIDPSNPYSFDAAGNATRTLPDGVSSGSVVASLLPPSAHYVKAFGTLAAPSLAPAAGRTPKRAVLFYATDDHVAQVAVERLINAAGFDPVRAGGVDAALRIEMFGDLHQYGGLNGQLLDVDQARSAVMAAPA